MKDLTQTARPPAELTIRGAAAADLPQLAEFVAALAAQHGDSARIDAETLARDLFGPQPWLRVLVAEIGGRLVGYAALCPRMQLQFGQRGMDLHQLYLTPEVRGRGHGRRLVEAAEELARGLGCSYMTVSADAANWQARKVYLGCGFTLLPAGGRFFRRALG